MRVPAEALTQYAASYETARQAGDLLLDEIGPLLQPPADAAQTCAVDPRRGYRPCFTVDLALDSEGAGRADEPPDIRLRRAALTIVADYNALLVALAQGDSAAALDARIGGVIALAQRAAELAPTTAALPLGLAAEPFRRLAVSLEAARAQDAAARAILEAEPDIRAMIRALRDDAPALYAVYVAQFEGEVGDLKIAQTRAELVGDAETAAALQARIDALTDTGAAANRARRMEAALTDYVRFLNHSDAALAELTARLRAPATDPFAGADALIATAVEGRLLAQNFLSDVQALRALSAR
jgi:hypothetical protein